MLNHVIAVVALAVACALWVVLQRWISARDPDARSVEDECASCSQVCEPPDETGGR